MSDSRAGGGGQLSNWPRPAIWTFSDLLRRSSSQRDHVANDALLGQGAYSAGHRATDLIPGADRGTSVVKGFTGEARSQIVQWYYLDPSKGNDQVTPLIERAMAAIVELGKPKPGEAPVQDRGPGPAGRPGPGARGRAGASGSRWV